MSTLVGPPLPPALPPEPIARISVNQYHFMIEHDLFAEDDPVELLEGWLVPKMPKKPPHCIATGLLLDELAPLLPMGWHLHVQDPVTTADSEPEPDVSVVCGGSRDYPDGHPTPKDVALLVEVSESTLARDRGMKKRIFARAGIPIYWIVNLLDRCIEVHTDPTGEGEHPDYQQKQIFGPDDSVPLILDGREIGRLEVKRVLP